MSAPRNKSAPAEQRTRTFSEDPILKALVIFAMTLLAYAPALRGGFLWDDDLLLSDNPLMKAGDGLPRLWCGTGMPDYYPLTWSSFWLEWRLWGMDPTGYHVMNVLLHGLGAVLIWQVLRQLRIPGAWLTGLIFAVHPVSVESVAWISERKNTLSIVWYALAFWLFLKSESNGRRGWYGLSVGAFLLGLLSKTSGVMLPVIMLLCAWWQRGRIDWKGLRRSAPFFALAVVFGLVTVWSQRNLGSGQHEGVQGEMFLQLATDSSQKGPLLRLNAAGHVFWFYLFKVLAPVNLMTIYPLWRLDTGSLLSWIPTLTTLAAMVVVWRFRRSWGRPLLFGVGYFGVMLLPVVGFLGMPYIGRSPVVTDHLQYLPMIGIIGLVAGALSCGSSGQNDLIRRTISGATVLLVGTLCFLSWRQAHIYTDELTLWNDAVSKNPVAPKAHYNLGVALNKRGQLDAAIAQYNRTLELKPDYADAHNNLANILVKRGQPEAALSHYSDAVRSRRRFPEAHRNWATTLLKLGRTDEALVHFSEAVRLKPDDAESQYNLGVILAGDRRLDEAIAHLTAAAHARPDYAEAHNNLGNALLGQGHFDEAVAEYAAALRFKPDYAEAHYNWGLALAGRDRLQEATTHFAEAVRLHPDDAQAQNNLGVVLASQGKFKEATVHFSEAARIRPDDPEYRRNLQQAVQAGVHP